MISLPEMNKLLSSAYKMGFRILLANCKSLIYKMNSKGPKQSPEAHQHL